MPVTPGQIDTVKVHHADGTTGTTKLQVIGVATPSQPTATPTAAAVSKPPSSVNAAQPSA